MTQNVRTFYLLRNPANASFLHFQIFSNLAQILMVIQVRIRHPLRREDQMYY